jgi:hypothetical protein
VTFVRSSGDEVTVDVTGPALPGDEAIGEKAGAIAIAHLDGTRSRMRLVWTVGRDL